MPGYIGMAGMLKGMPVDLFFFEQDHIVQMRNCQLQCRAILYGRNQMSHFEKFSREDTKARKK